MSDTDDLDFPARIPWVARKPRAYRLNVLLWSGAALVVATVAVEHLLVRAALNPPTEVLGRYVLDSLSVVSSLLVALRVVGAVLIGGSLLLRWGSAD